MKIHLHDVGGPGECGISGDGIAEYCIYWCVRRLCSRDCGAVHLGSGGGVGDPGQFLVSLSQGLGVRAWYCVSATTMATASNVPNFVLEAECADQ